MDSDSVLRDSRSDIHKQFDDIANRCVASLLAISDRGSVLCPLDISVVAQEIVKELGALYFNGLPEQKS